MIKKLMELGVIVEADAAKILEKGDTDKIVERIRNMSPKPLVINVGLAKKLLAKDVKIKLLKKVKKMESMSISDFVATYNERYSALQKILLKNPKLSNTISIKESSGECSVIGLVKKNTGQEIEDPSGAKALETDRKDLMEGDVVGATGTVENNLFRAREIIFPGVQLKERNSLLGRFSVGTAEGCDIKTDSNAWYDVNGCILVTADTELSQLSKELGVPEKESALQLLKRGHLTAPPKDFLEPRPDVLVLNSTENFLENFKGVMVVGVKKGEKAVIDLEKKEVEFERAI